MELAGATALLIGAADRLGRAIALSLAQAGTNVVIVYRRSSEAARETAERVSAYGVRGLALQADATDVGQIDSVVRSVLRALARIDLLVVTAGAFRPTPLDSVVDADWDDMWQSNFETVRIATERVAPEMQRQGDGCIITLADVAGVHPWPAHIPYSVAKSCVIALTMALAVDLAPTIRVNAIAPGPVLFPTDFPADAAQREIARTLLNRQGAPGDIDAAVHYLARNDYVTGTLLPVDGGRLLRS